MKLNLFAVLLLLGGILSIFTAGMIRWASLSDQDNTPLVAAMGAPSPVARAPIATALASATIVQVVRLEASATIAPTEAPASTTPLPADTATPEIPTATATEVPPAPTDTPTSPPTDTPTSLPTNTRIPTRVPTRTPVRTVYYKVVSGDNLIGIAARFRVTVDAIMRANNLSSTFIYAGQVLIIPVR